MMNVMVINGSPRKNWNTYQLLQKAREGAGSAGATVEMVNLYDYIYTGCRSCLACKLKEDRSGGICVIRDALRPVLEKAHEADVIIMGAPVYFGHPAAQLESFAERFMFPILRYAVDKNGIALSKPHCTKAVGIIFTMNVNEEQAKQFHYDILLGNMVQMSNTLFGHCESLYAYDTCQVNDYSRYDMPVFDSTHKMQRRKEAFPLDLQLAYELGKRLAEQKA